MRSFTLGFFLGTLSVLWLTALPSNLVLLLSGISSIGCLFGFSHLTRQMHWHKAGINLLLGLLLGCSSAVYSSWHLHTQWPTTALEQQVLRLNGRVSSVPQYHDRSMQFLFTLDENQALTGKLTVSWYQPYAMDLHAGERWQLTLKVKRPHATRNPNTLDHEKWLFAERITGIAQIKAKATQQKLAAAPWWYPQTWREHSKQRLTHILANSKVLGLIQGLAIADTGDISDTQWQVLQQTGTVHLLAISGLHITMVAALALLPVGVLWYRYPKLALLVPRPVAAAVLGALFASFYVLLAGSELPAQRTLIMLLVFMLSLVARRAFSFSQTYSLALLLVLLYDPLACLSAGFWLSFVTVGLLVWLGTRQYRLPTGSVLRIQLGLSLLTLPLSAAFFGLVAWIAPIANLIAIPWITFIVTPLILLGMLLDLVSHSLAALLWQLAALLLEWLMQLLAYLANLPFAASHTLLYPTLWLSIAGLGMVFLLLPKGMPTRWLGFICLAPLLLYQTPPLDKGSFQLSVLDVGQGSAHVIQTATHRLVFDTGVKSSDSFDMGKRVVLPYLYGQGIRQLDLLMLSHADNDHNGGALALAQTMPIQQIMGSSPEVLPDYKVTLCQAGQHWQWDGVNFEVLHPSANFTGKSDNERSCVLRVSNAHHSVLLTGDIEKDAELQLVKPQHSLASEVLILAHHGSKYSSSYTFLDAVQPKLAIVSSGYLNRFNHPHPETINRLTQHGIPWLNTVQSGAIRLYFPPNADAFNLEQWRLLDQHIWHESGQ